MRPRRWYTLNRPLVVHFKRPVTFLPQAIKIIVTKETKSLSLIMYVMLVIGVALWLVYGVLKHDIPLIAANGVTLLFASIILTIKIKNKD